MDLYLGKKVIAWAVDNYLDIEPSKPVTLGQTREQKARSTSPHLPSEPAMGRWA